MGREIGLCRTGITTTYITLYPVAEENFRQSFEVQIRATKTGEYRKPEKGEWFLSGPGAYKAPNDLSQEYWIAKLVEARHILEIVREVQL